MPNPDILGRNGTYVVFRKLHQRVWAFRKYLKANSSSPEEEQLIAAKMMGRWSSGAPLALCPERDDPELGADPQRNNNFLFQDTDPKGFNCSTNDFAESGRAAISFSSIGTGLGTSTVTTPSKSAPGRRTLPLIMTSRRILGRKIITGD